eukprot:symbB.v1.2.038188.t1/scaffold5865.1/size22968/3
MPVASASCWSFAAAAGVCGLAKVGMGACAAGCIAGAAELAHSVVRNMIESIGQGNTRRWFSMVVAEQPPQHFSPPAQSGGSSSDSGNVQGWDDPSAESSESSPQTTLPAGGVLELPRAAVDRCQVMKRRELLWIHLDSRQAESPRMQLPAEKCFVKSEKVLAACLLETAGPTMAPIYRPLRN